MFSWPWHGIQNVQRKPALLILLTSFPSVHVALALVLSLALALALAMALALALALVVVLVARLRFLYAFSELQPLIHVSVDASLAGQLLSVFVACLPLPQLLSQEPIVSQ